jgi:hypothetical protein
MALHKSLTYADGHVVHAYVYANATARLAATGFVAADVGKVAQQTDTNGYYVLTDESPITWVLLASGAAAWTHRVDMAGELAATNLDVYTRMGAGLLNSTSYPGVYNLRVLVQVDEEVSYSVRLYDLTAGAYITGTITDTNEDLELQSLTGLTLGAGERLYEVHAKLNAGAGGSDYVRVAAAYLEVVA